MRYLIGVHLAELRTPVPVLLILIVFFVLLLLLLLLVVVVLILLLLIVVVILLLLLVVVVVLLVLLLLVIVHLLRPCDLKSNAHAQVCAFALDVVKNVTDERTNGRTRRF